MAIVDGRTPLDLANATTNFDDFTAATGISLETDTIIEGTGSIAETNDSTTTWQGVCFDAGSDVDYSGNHLYFWFNHAAAGLVQTFVFRAMTSSGNWIQKIIAQPTFNRELATYTGGWVPFVVSVDKLFEQFDTHDGTAPTAGTARYWGIGAKLISGVMPKKQDNLFMDAAYRLPASTPGIRFEGTNGGVPWTWQDLVDWSLSNGNGLAQEVGGIIYVNAPIQIGDSASTSSTEFLDANGRIVSFTADDVDEDFFFIQGAGNGTGTTDISFGTVVGSGDDRQGAGGGVIRSARRPFSMDFETDIADLDTVNFYGVTFQGMSTGAYSSSTKTDIIGCTFSDCGEQQPNDAEWLNNTVIAPRNRGLEMLSTHNIKQTNFIAGDRDTPPATFGTNTTSASATPGNPYTFSHTVATGSENVALLLLVGYEYADNTSPIFVASYNSEEMFRIGMARNPVSTTASPTIEAFLLYNPTEGSSSTVSLTFGATPPNIAVYAVNVEGCPPLGKVKTFASIASSATAVDTTATAALMDAYSIDMTFLDTSGPGGTGVATAGDATEIADAAIGSEASYFIASVAGGLFGARDHDWTWTGSSNAAQLVVLFEDTTEEHHVHLPNIGDGNTVTFDAMKFFGFGAAGAPKWNGENSESSADITINATNGSNPSATDFENTASGTVTVNNAVTVTIGGMTEGSSCITIADETVGTITAGDILNQSLADSNGEVVFTINYEGAFDPTGLDVLIRARNQGFPTAAILDDNASYTDYTTEANSAVADDDVNLLPATPVANQDGFIMGHAEPFTRLKIDVTTAGTGGFTITWQYWNGAWTSLSGVSDGTSSFSVAGRNEVSWTLPGDWATTTINSQGPYYYIRALYTAGSVTVVPLAKKITLDVTRYRPTGDESRTITSDGLTTVVPWVRDLISQF